MITSPSYLCQAQLIEHRLEEARTDFFLAILYGGESIAVMEAAVAPFP
jgi:hypothetical protein